jgi:hypothetical protein
MDIIKKQYFFSKFYQFAVVFYKLVTFFLTATRLVFSLVCGGPSGFDRSARRTPKKLQSAAGAEESQEGFANDTRLQYK